MQSAGFGSGLHVKKGKKKTKRSMVHVYGVRNLYANKFGLGPVEGSLHVLNIFKKKSKSILILKLFE